MRCWRRGIACAFVVLMLHSGTASAQDQEIERLIDELLGISEPGFGYSVYFAGGEFLPFQGTGQMGVLVLGVSRATRSEALRKLVEKGAAAVPVLLKHIGDTRTIKMKPVSGMMWMDFPDEYDFNRRTRKTPPQGVNRHSFRSGNDQPRDHAITVGDLCFVALGQVVNRHFSATRYQPSGGLMVNSPTYSKALREVILQDWSGLTRQRHKDLLIDDFTNPDDEDRRIGAYLRLACYYPDAVEPLVLKQLAEPVYDSLAGSDFIRETLYRVKDTADRKRRFDAFVAKHGEAARQGLLLDLFQDLDTQQADEEGRLHPPLKEKYEARACLVELYGYPRTVKSSDCPHLLQTTKFAQARFIKTLTHDRSQKVGDAVRRIFQEHHDDNAYAPACLVSLASRGYGPFLVEQLSKINVADSKGNPLHLKYIEAVSQSQEEDVRKKLLEIVKTTTNDEYFMAALPAIDRSHDALVLKRARELLARLPPDTDRGESILQMIGQRFPEQAKTVYRSFLATGSAGRAETMCVVLWYGNPMAVEILAPLLDDKRSLPGFSTPMRVCDRAATAISQTSEKLSFDSDWSTAKKDQAIERIRQYCRGKVK
jgi:hypothetical protein